MEYKFTNKRGHRGRQHRNFICHPKEGLALEFLGESLPGCRVLREDFYKSGKWSHYLWTVEVDEQLVPLVFREDWETGEYFPERTWEAATRRPELVEALGSRGAVEGFARHFFQQTAIRLEQERTSVAKPEKLVELMRQLQTAQDAAATAKYEADLAAVNAAEAMTVQEAIQRANINLARQEEAIGEARELAESLPKLRQELARLQMENRALEQELQKAVEAEATKQKLEAEKKKAATLASLKGQTLSLADFQKRMAGG